MGCIVIVIVIVVRPTIGVGDGFGAGQRHGGGRSSQRKRQSARPPPPPTTRRTTRRILRGGRCLHGNRPQSCSRRLPTTTGGFVGGLLFSPHQEDRGRVGRDHRNHPGGSRGNHCIPPSRDRVVGTSKSKSKTLQQQQQQQPKTKKAFRNERKHPHTKIARIRTHNGATNAGQEGGDRTISGRKQGGNYALEGSPRSPILL
mmetsp:Transcript_15856/g.32894  ORF Transcript_15856/g.32894 Transcript_15856/m.32894 type:complete len:201 (-) Transcript_15856:4011-4613(-)